MNHLLRPILALLALLQVGEVARTTESLAERWSTPQLIDIGVSLLLLLGLLHVAAKLRRSKQWTGPSNQEAIERLEKQMRAGFDNIAKEMGAMRKRSETAELRANEAANAARTLAQQHLGLSEEVGELSKMIEEVLGPRHPVVSDGDN